MKGLPTNFQLQNGKFLLTEGAEKAYDRLYMLVSYDKFREAVPDYAPGIIYMQQRPVSYLLQFQIILLGGISALIDKYCPEIRVDAIGFYQSTTDRRLINLSIAFTYLPTNTANKAVIFL